MTLEQKLQKIADDVNSPPTTPLGRLVDRLQDVANEAAAKYLGDPWRIAVVKPPFTRLRSHGPHVFGLCVAPQISEHDTLVLFRVHVPDEDEVFPIQVERWDDDDLVCHDEESLHAVVWEMMAHPSVQKIVADYGERPRRRRA